MITRRLKSALLLFSILTLACCSKNAVQTPDPQTALESIPAADPAQFEHIQDMRKWQNPYLIVRADGVVLYDSADSAEIILKTDEVLPALAGLPASKWPYGRVVAVAVDATKAPGPDAVAIRRNKGIVGGMLDSAHIAVKWAPTG